MADITINDLKTTGAEFFADSESFMSEITDEEFNISGGLIWTTVTVTLLFIPQNAY